MNFPDDVDAACFMMDIRDLPQMFGELVRPATQLARLRDPAYKEWINIISDPVIVKIYGGDTARERLHCKRSICDVLRRKHGLALTVGAHSLILSNSRVNIPLEALVESLRACKHKECRVGFYGMKWAYRKARPIIDRVIQLHGSLHPLLAVKQNTFDIGTRLPATEVNIFTFSKPQRVRHLYRRGSVHEMFNREGWGSLEFNVLGHPNVGTIKIYQELTHEVLSQIPKTCLDDEPRTVRTMRTRWRQMEKLLRTWHGYGDDELKEHLLGTRIEVSVKNVHKVEEAYRLCAVLDLLTIGGIEDLLGATFDVESIPVTEIVTDLSDKLDAMAVEICGANDNPSTIRMRTALTEARQSMGWSGKNMPRYLMEAREWRESQGLRGQGQAEGEAERFNYDGWEGDDYTLRPIIQDILENAHWQNHSATSARNRVAEPIFLKSVKRNGFFKQRTKYVDRVGGARYFAARFGVMWRNHIRERPAATEADGPGEVHED
ncbi:hypothetical protein KC19_8G000200 [Ceratodon purpureus]|uniref:Uncharacterized protein n=1 Tax=Ceratodon purpureus TaxID=3225 RepID=A0A8T0GY46_CERPU|nr:hypothetical protein KC19_8G000200 [Ceratodon purpureus]